MITHIVFLNMKEEADGFSKMENRDRLAEALNDLTGKIPQIIKLEVGKNENTAEVAWDLSLYTTFASWEDLQVYQAHPEHQLVLQLIGKIVSQKAVVDYPN